MSSRCAPTALIPTLRPKVLHEDSRISVSAKIGNLLDMSGLRLGFLICLCAEPPFNAK